MEKQDVFEIIRISANKWGFDFVQNGFGAMIKDGLDWNKAWVNFTITEKPDWKLAKHDNGFEIPVYLEFSASIARMGGSMSVAELADASGALARAASLVVELNNKKLQYVGRA